MEAQAKTLSHMENTCKYLGSRIDSLTKQSKRLGNKYGKRKGEGENDAGLNTKDMRKQKYDNGETSKVFFRGSKYSKR